VEEILFLQLQGDIDAMKRSFIVAGITLLFALVASATDVSQFETFLGYNFVRFNPNSGYIPSFNANGGGGQFVYNFNRWLGVVLDAGAVNKGTLNGFNFDTTVVNFVAGPRVTFHNHSRFQPFAQVLFGGAYATTSTSIAVLTAETAVVPPRFNAIPGGPATARVGFSNTGFAMMAGGGLDIKLSKQIAFRPIGADYYLMRLPSLLTGNTTNRNNFRYSAGINFMFGAR
jgi:opacity protein-like surface antigen